MKDEDLYLLLHLIKNKGNLYDLTVLNYDFAQMSRHLKSLKEKNIIELYKDSLNLTNNGEQLINDLADVLNYKGSARFISPQVYYHRSQISKEDIFLP